MLYPSPPHLPSYDPMSRLQLLPPAVGLRYDNTSSSGVLIDPFAFSTTTTTTTTAADHNSTTSRSNTHGAAAIRTGIDDDNNRMAMMGKPMTSSLDDEWESKYKILDKLYSDAGNHEDIVALVRDLSNVDKYGIRKLHSKWLDREWCGMNVRYGNDYRL
ncbi:hypothetical protein FOZ62_018846, partial [Perkinsus olseni]